MAGIGVRELKIHASEIVRKVHEKRVHYVVTRRGQPVAVIIPIEEGLGDTQAESSAWDELVTLGQQIGQNWQSPQTSSEILEEMRR